MVLLFLLLAILLVCPCLSLGEAKVWSCQTESLCVGSRHIYMTSDGRISLAGLPSSKAEYLAKAIDDCVRNH